MAVIQSKKMPVIKKGEGYVYIPATFAKEHKVANFHTIEDPQELLRLVDPFEFHGRKFIVFDTETHPYYANSHLVPKGIVRRWVGSGKKASPQDFPFCISICDGKNAYSIFDTVENGFAKFKQLAPLFEDPTVEMIAHNAKFDMHEIANADMKIVGKIHDTVVQTKLTDENRKSFKLRDIAARNPRGIVKFEYMVDNYKQMNKVTDYRQIPRELISEYANADVWNAFVTFVDEWPILEQDNLMNLYEKELELMMALYAMERRGMKTDESYVKPMQDELQALTIDAEKLIYEEAGEMFNINSGPQLFKVLMKLGVKSEWISKTDKGNPSLDKDALEKLAEVYDVSIVHKILEYRKYEKLLNTYAIGIEAQVDSLSIVHSSINQTEATTGRMSITKPALQTLPKKDKRIRKYFIPQSDDYEMWMMDLDQVEYRIFAHYAKAEGLLEAIRNGLDVHQATAALIFKKLFEDITEAERNSAKTTNFALVYGQGDERTAISLKMNMSAARRFKENYFAQIPEALPFIKGVHAVVKMRGFVKNMFDRRRRLGSNDAYKAPNALIQGCAADYIKDKCVDIYKYLMYHKLKTFMSNIVHDELILQMHKAEIKLTPQLRWLLSDFVKFRCPITAGCDKGAPSWGEKVSMADIGFDEPTDKSYLEYNVFDGAVFDIDKEVA